MNKAGKCNEKEKKGVVGVEGGRVALTRSWLPIIPNTGMCMNIKRQRIIIIEETRIYWKDVRLEGKARDIWNGMRKKV